MNLHEYRKLKYVSVKQASEELGISRQHIYDIEKGKSFPSRKLAITIYKWSKGLVTQVELLFPDPINSANDNLINVKNWEQSKRGTKKHKLHGARIMENDTYINVRVSDDGCISI